MIWLFHIKESEIKVICVADTGDCFRHYFRSRENLVQIDGLKKPQRYCDNSSASILGLALLAVPVIHRFYPKGTTITPVIFIGDWSHPRVYSYKSLPVFLPNAVALT